MKSQNHFLKGLLFCGVFISMMGTSQANEAKLHAVYTHVGNVDVHEDVVNSKRSEARPIGSIGEGKEIVGYDEMGKPIVKSCYPYTSCLKKSFK